MGGGYKKILGIFYLDHITNDTVYDTIRQEAILLEDLQTTIKEEEIEMVWATLQEPTILGNRKIYEQVKWADDITE